MPTTFSIIATFAWALWLGGLGCLFLCVQVLFAADRATALDAAPIMFIAFERYQLGLAAICLLGAAAWWLSRPSRWLAGAFALFALATIGAILLPMTITGRMEDLRLRGEGAGAEFRQLHGRAMMVYTGESAALAAAGVMLVLAGRRREAN